MKEYDIQLLNISKDNHRETTEYDLMLVGPQGSRFFKVPVSGSQAEDTKRLYRMIKHQIMESEIED